MVQDPQTSQKRRKDRHSERGAKRRKVSDGKDKKENGVNGVNGKANGKHKKQKVLNGKINGDHKKENGANGQITGDHKKENETDDRITGEDDEVPRLRINDDVEFADDDYEGRIARYEQRIREGLSKYTYEQKIASLKAAQKARDEILAQFPGKSMRVIERIGTLEIIERHLEKKGDPCGELVNVKAILQAYRDGDLECNDKATYWGQGKMVAGPSKFSWEDFRKYNTEKNRGDGGFWLEGPYRSRIKHRKARMYYGPEVEGHGDRMMVHHVIRLDNDCARVDNTGVAFPELNLKFMDDSGCDDMYIFHSDMKNLMGADATPDMPAPRSHMMGYSVATLADGSPRVTICIAVQVNMIGVDEHGAEQRMVDNWTTIGCDVSSPDAEGYGCSRLNGSWMRTMLYVGSAPGFLNRIYASTHKEGFLGAGGLPDVPLTDRVGPYFDVPDTGVKWTFDPVRNQWKIAQDDDIEPGIPPSHEFYYE